VKLFGYFKQVKVIARSVEFSCFAPIKAAATSATLFFIGSINTAGLPYSHFSPNNLFLPCNNPNLSIQNLKGWILGSFNFSVIFFGFDSKFVA
jgi:hypothetical protein